MAEKESPAQQPLDVHAEGWSVLHMYYRIDRALWSSLDEKEQEEGLEEFMALLVAAEQEEGLQVVAQGVIGKADFGLVVVHPKIARVQRFTQEVAATTLGACFETAYSYLSLSEVSEYQTSTGDFARKLIDEEGLAPDTDEFRNKLGAFAERMEHYAAARLYPELPGKDMPVICFYPMSKQRGDRYNWYGLSLAERKRLMGEHASVLDGDATGRALNTEVLALADVQEQGCVLLMNLAGLALSGDAACAAALHDAKAAAAVVRVMTMYSEQLEQVEGAAAALMQLATLDLHGCMEAGLAQAVVGLGLG